MEMRLVECNLTKLIHFINAELMAVAGSLGLVVEELSLESLS